MSDFVAGRCGRLFPVYGIGYGQNRWCGPGAVCPHCKRILELEAWQRAMIEKVADEHLPAYREQGDKMVALEIRNEKLKAELAALREKVRWRRVGDGELPEKSGHVLVWGGLHGETGRHRWSAHYSNWLDDTLWMQLPEGPKSEGPEE